MSMINLTTVGSNTFDAYLREAEPVQKWCRKSDKQKSTGQGKNTVGQLIKSAGTLPETSLMLGVCADGMPLFINLFQVPVSPILITCGQGRGKTHHLQVLADSAMQLQRKGNLEIAVLSFNPAEWSDLCDRPSNRHVILEHYTWYEPKAKKMIEGLTELAERRRMRKDSDDDILLFLDDLEGLLDLDRESQVNLRWLLEYGAQSHIWPIATLDSDQSDGFDFWVEPFKTTINGCAGRQMDAGFDKLQAGMVTSLLEPGEFSMPMGKRWLTYHLPMLGS
jgi:hypothetical protein